MTPPSAYSFGGIRAKQIDKHTGWFDQAEVQGVQAKEFFEQRGVNETVADVAGGAMTAIQSANPLRLISDPLTDWLLD